MDLKEVAYTLSASIPSRYLLKLRYGYLTKAVREVRSFARLSSINLFPCREDAIVAGVLPQKANADKMASIIGEMILLPYGRKSCSGCR